MEFLALSREQFVATSTGYSMGSQERSLLIGQIRRRLSTAFIRANSLCTISRVSNTGPGSRASAKRREWAMQEEENMRREKISNWNAFMSGGGGKRGGIHFFPG